MLIDHLTASMMERAILPQTGQIAALSSDLLYWVDRTGRAIGRQTFPIVIFLLAEGFYHTGNRIRYLGRLLLLAVISEVPYYLTFCSGEVGSLLTPSHNTVFTLVLGYLAIWIVDAIRMRGIRQNNERAHILYGILAAAAVGALYYIAEKSGVDYGGAGVIAIVLCYFLRSVPRMGPVGAYVWLGSNDSYEWFALPACILMCCYNGERYPKKVIRRQQMASPLGRRLIRYVFYLFYPLHLLAVWGLRILVQRFLNN